MWSRTASLQAESAMSRASRAESQLAEWARQHGPALRSYFARRVSEVEAEDLVQEVFLRLHAMRDETPVENADRFIFTVARNILISRYRYQKTRLAGAHESLTDASDPVDSLSPERIVIGIDEYERTVEAILQLPPRARAAFQFHRFEKMTYQQIAVRMGISHQSVKELIHRALVRLVERLDSDA